MSVDVNAPVLTTERLILTIPGAQAGASGILTRRIAVRRSNEASTRIVPARDTRFASSIERPGWAATFWAT